MESKDPYLNLIYDLLRLFIHLDGISLKRSRIHRHRNPLYSRIRRREAVPAPLFRDEVHKKHLSIHFESQFTTPVLAPNNISNREASWGRSTRPQAKS